jgi:hypothetical protein
MEWKHLKENNGKPPPMLIASSTPPPLNHISGVVAQYEFLVQFMKKPKALTSTDLWQDNVDEQDFATLIEQF